MRVQSHVFKKKKKFSPSFSSFSFKINYYSLNDKINKNTLMTQIDKLLPQLWMSMRELLRNFSSLQYFLTFLFSFTSNLQW